MLLDLQARAAVGEGWIHEGRDGLDQLCVVREGIGLPLRFAAQQGCRPVGEGQGEEVRIFEGRPRCRVLLLQTERQEAQHHRLAGIQLFAIGLSEGKRGSREQEITTELFLHLGGRVDQVRDIVQVQGAFDLWIDLLKEWSKAEECEGNHVGI
jgi:hypothetical protein